MIICHSTGLQAFLIKLQRVQNRSKTVREVQLSVSACKLAILYTRGIHVVKDTERMSTMDCGVAVQVLSYIYSIIYI